MRILLPIFAVFLIGLATNSVYASDGSDEGFIKKMSDFINGNWMSLLLVAVVFLLFGFLIPGLASVGVLLIIIILLNWLLISPSIHGG